VFEDRVLRRIFGPKRKEVTEWWKKLHNAYTICTLRQILTGSLSQGGLNG
jgi:hypothetical protein